MSDDGEDDDKASAPPRPTPPRPKRESIVLEGKAQGADPKPAPPPPSAAPRSGAAPIAAGAVGGVVGAVLILAGLWLFDTNPGPAALAKRLDALEARQASAEKEAEAGLPRLAALELGGAASAAERKGLSDRIAALEAASKPEAIAALAGKLSALETAEAASAAERKSLSDRLAALEAAALPQAIAALAGKLGALETAQSAGAVQQKALGDDLAALKAAPAPAAPGPDLEKRIAALEARAPADAPSPPAASDPRVAALVADETALAARLAKQTEGAEALGARLDKLEAAVFSAKAQTRVAPSEATKPSAGPTPPTIRAIAALSLRARVRAGEPYAAELAALATAGADPAALAPLSPFAEAGVSTPAALSRAFQEIAAKLRAAPAPPQPSGAVFDRLVGEVQGLVRVRKTGDGAGGDAGSPSDVEAALADGDLAGAVAALKTLPATALAAASDWRKAAEARLAAAKAADALVRQAIADLGGAKK